MNGPPGSRHLNLVCGLVTSIVGTALCVASPATIAGGLISVMGIGTVCLSLKEIRERRRLEDELKKTAAKLAHSNQDLGQFAYIASHDLQEPLRAVAGCVQILRQRYGGKLDARADELIAHAVDGASRMQRLLKDLLEYSRIGTHGKDFEWVDGESVVDAALANLRNVVKESNAAITRDKMPSLSCDPAQLTQLFQNLLDNAIKYRSERAPKIHIGAVHQEREWRFAVSDNGIGIDRQHFEAIFGVFQRLHTRREYSGTGIGLAVCKKIAERHGGRIWVESEPGRGSTFYFTVNDSVQA